MVGRQCEWLNLGPFTLGTGYLYIATKLFPKENQSFLPKDREVELSGSKQKLKPVQKSKLRCVLIDPQKSFPNNVKSDAVQKGREMISCFSPSVDSPIV